MLVRDPDRKKTTVNVTPDPGNHTFKKMKMQAANGNKEGGSSSQVADAGIGS